MTKEIYDSYGKTAFQQSYKTTVNGKEVLVSECSEYKTIFHEAEEKADMIVCFKDELNPHFKRYLFANLNEWGYVNVPVKYKNLAGKFASIPPDSKVKMVRIPKNFSYHLMFIWVQYPNINYSL